MSSETQLRLGVDLGTTWTAAAVSRAGAGTPETVDLGDAGSAMPSVIALDGATIVVGDTAERRLLADPAAGTREPKRRLGDTTPFIIGGTPYGAEALMGHLLRHVVATVTASAGSAPSEIVVTHPANWGEYKIDLLREAARIADVGDIVLVTEPEAAAAHYVRLGRVQRGQTVAVYDFGGGTFDVAIVRCSDEGTTVLGEPQGLERLGGLDLDEAILAHVNSALDGRLAELDPDDPAVRKGMAQLRVECTKAKEALSADSETTVPIALPGVITDIRITRDEFEAAIRSRIADTLAALDRAIASAGITTDDLAGVLLVGGSSRIPLVTEQVASHTGRPVLVDADAKLVVALGAAGGLSIISTDAAGATVASPTESTAVDQPREAPVAEAPKPADPKTPSGSGTGSPTAAPGGAKAPTKKAPAKPAAADKKVTPGRVAAGVAGVAAAAGVTAAGMAAAGALTSDDADLGDPGDLAAAVAEAPAPADESMDAFDEAGGGGGFAGGGGGGGFAGGGGGGGGGARSAGAARRSAPADDGPDAPASRPTAQRPSDATTSAPTTATSPEIETVRAELRERLEKWEPPEGTDPAEAAELRAELEGLVDRFQPLPGQTTEQAVASVRDQFEDKVEDFSQDQKIDALVEEQHREDAVQAALDAQVTEMKSTLADRLTTWQPPEGTDPAAVAELRTDLGAIIDNYVAVPGSTDAQAIAELQRRFDSRVTDFTQEQKIDALVGLESSMPTDGTTTPTDATSPTDGTSSDPLVKPVVPASDATPDEVEFPPEVSMPKPPAATGPDGTEPAGETPATTGDPTTGMQTAPAPDAGVRPTAIDVFDQMVTNDLGSVAEDPDAGGEVFTPAADLAQSGDLSASVVDFGDDMVGNVANPMVGIDTSDLTAPATDVGVVDESWAPIDVDMPDLTLEPALLGEADPFADPLADPFADVLAAPALDADPEPSLPAPQPEPEPQPAPTGLADLNDPSAG